MITRRHFLAAVGIIPPAVAIFAPEMVRRSFFLPPKGGWRFDASPYLTSPNTWYLPDYPFIEVGVEMRDGRLHRYRRVLGPDARAYVGEKYRIEREEVWDEDTGKLIGVYT